jgi:hypothetical protein
MKQYAIKTLVVSYDFIRAHFGLEAAWKFERLIKPVYLWARGES